MLPNSLYKANIILIPKSDNGMEKKTKDKYLLWIYMQNPQQQQKKPSKHNKKGHKYHKNGIFPIKVDLTSKTQSV